MNDDEAKPGGEGPAAPPAGGNQPPPLSPQGNGEKKEKFGCGALFLGGVLCIALLCTGALGIGLLALALPLAAGLVMVAFRRTRHVGLGVLIAYGTLWLAFLAICGRGGFRM